MNQAPPARIHHRPIVDSPAGRGTLLAVRQQ
jgi:hypothetical protein